MELNFSKCSVGDKAVYYEGGESVLWAKYETGFIISVSEDNIIVVDKFGETFRFGKNMKCLNRERYWLRRIERVPEDKKAEYFSLQEKCAGLAEESLREKNEILERLSEVTKPLLDYLNENPETDVTLARNSEGQWVCILNGYKSQKEWIRTYNKMYDE